MNSINNSRLKDKSTIIKAKNNHEFISYYAKKKMTSNRRKETSQNDESSAQVSATENVEDVAISTFNNARNRLSTRTSNRYRSYKSSPTQMNKSNILDKRTRFIFNNNNTNTLKPVNNRKIRYYHKPTNKIRHHIQKTTKAISPSIKSIFTATKQAIFTASNILSYMTGAILLIVITLFIGVFSSLSDSSVYGYPLSPLSEEVLAYTDMITDYAKQYDIEEFVPLIQAIMMEESSGLGNDPMDASQFSYNTNYPNEITSPTISIDVGVHYLADCLIKANVTSPSDTEKLYLAIQAYDYQIDYLDWVINNFGGYSKANAKVYLDIKKEQTNNTFEGNANYVADVWIYYRGSGSRIVEIAKAQVGNVGGRKYWEWYGFDSRVEWCACFVSWCAEQSGDLNITIPRFSGVDSGMSWFMERNKWRYSNYIPSPGDVIFFDWDYDNDPDHLGIVEKVEGNIVHTIEGNSNDKCRNKSYNLSSIVILGYGII